MFLSMNTFFLVDDSMIMIVRLALFKHVYRNTVKIHLHNILWNVTFGMWTHYLLFADCLPDTPANSSRLSLTARCGYLYLLSTAAIAASLQRGIVCVARDGSCLAPQRINGSQSTDVPFEKLYPDLILYVRI